MYRQCRLHRPPDTYTYTWLPLKVASKGKRVALHGEEGWIVERVWSLTRTKDEVFVLGDQHRRHREETDI